MNTKKQIILFNILLLLLMAFPVSSKGSIFIAPPQKKRVVSQTYSDLNTRLSQFIQKNAPEGAVVGVEIYDLTAQKSVFRKNATVLCRPASTMKLLTAITALDNGIQHTPFVTELWYDGEIKGDTLWGNLHLLGGFDPEFGEVEMDSLAEAVSALPFKTIMGKLVGDISVKDSLYWGNGWLWDDNPEAFQPYMTPLMYNKGAVRIQLKPGAKGTPAVVNVIPKSSYYTVINRTLSMSPKEGRCRVTRDWMNNKNDILLSGNISSPCSFDMNLYGSEGFFMQTFLDKLHQKGIQIDGYEVGTFLPSNSAVKIAEHQTPVENVLDTMLKESDNLNAEAMLWRIGRLVVQKGVKAEDGIKYIKSMIQKVGLSPTHYRIADGCGLSHYDYISPELLVALLKYAHNCAWFPMLDKALPIGGVDGTLNYRMSKYSPSYNNVHAKTGSYTGINCLAGYLKGRNGHQYAFAIMVQNTLSAKKARDLQDKLCDMVILN